MITNRHVLEGEKTVVIRLKEKGTGDLKIIDIPLEENGHNLYSVHDDPKIDIAVVLFSGSIVNNMNLQLSAFQLDKHVMTSFELVEQGGDEGTYVYMLGFPMGLVNVDSNTPICRGGCIARIDEKEIQQTKRYLLDIQNFPGNSGSPIITKPEISSIGDDPVLNRSVLIGIVHGYIPYEEKLIGSVNSFAQIAP